MKLQTLIGLAAVTMIGLSACSHNKATPKNTSTSSNTHYVNAQQEVTVKRVVYRQPTQQARAPHRQRAASQQVNRSGANQNRTGIDNNNLIRVDNSELYAIGDKIFQNEAGGRIDQLVHWNKRENFAAMGIGHFTWYPAGRRARYGNTFPGLLDYLQKNGIQLPHWIQRARFEGAPWRSRAELMRAKNTPEVRDFAQLLYNTRHLQAQYIMDRAMRAMPRLVKKTPQHLRGLVAGNLNAVANSRGGRYVLIDYINFKGEGLNRNGGYKGHNWGLLQVLEEMRPSNIGPQALNEFANAAMRVLERRVRNSNPSRNERKWLPGWRNRTNTYRRPI